MPEKDALALILGPVRKAAKTTGCNRAILDGAFDLGFLKAPVEP